MEPSRTTTRTDETRIEAAVALRHRLHEVPELAFGEEQTAAAVAAFLSEHGLEPVARGLAGHGLLYRIDGGREGPVRLFRADLDGLPLHEASEAPHTSKTEGHHHACGHDGHTAMLAGALAAIAERRAELPGTLYALFQPAEETGQGAARVLQDPAFPDVMFEAVYGIHNLPGRPLGEVYLREGSMACASVGLEVRLEGATSHAASPHEGRNPIPALAAFTLRAEALPATTVAFGHAALVTPIHLRAGQIAYGTAAGAGSAHFTVRAERQQDLDRLLTAMGSLAEALAVEGGFSLTIEEHEPFPATENAPQAVAAIERAAQQAGLPVSSAPRPLPWSEDFGHFTTRFAGALLCLGAGEDRPELHTPRYDFPDELVSIGMRFWTTLALGGGSS